MQSFLKRNCITVNDIVILDGLTDKTILDMDIRKLSLRSGNLPESVVRSQTEKITGPVFLQIAKVVDTTRSAADGPSERPGLLIVSVSDGNQKFDIALVRGVCGLAPAKTAPGTKIVLTGSWEILNGVLFPATSGNLEIAGGHVASLFETWKTNTEVKEQRALFEKSGTGDREGAPKFVPFDAKVAKKTSAERVKKAPLVVARPDDQQKPQVTEEPPRVVESVEASEKARELLRGKKVEKRFTSDKQNEGDRRQRGGRKGGKREGQRLEEEYRPPPRNCTGIGLGDLITSALLESKSRQ